MVYSLGARSGGCSVSMASTCPRTCLPGRERGPRESAQGINRITYQRGDLDGLKLPEADTASYGLVYSSLTLHYPVHLEEAGRRRSSAF